MLNQIKEDITRIECNTSNVTRVLFVMMKNKTKRNRIQQRRYKNSR